MRTRERGPATNGAPPDINVSDRADNRDSTRQHRHLPVARAVWLAPCGRPGGGIRGSGCGRGPYRVTARRWGR